MEDYALIRESLRAMLELEPEVELVGDAADAERALQQLPGLHVDVVLMDIGLPGMNGIEATRLLKGEYQDLSVLILTSYQDEYLGEAIEAGAAGYILKSCTRQQLVQAVQAAFEGRSPIDPSLTAGLVREVAELRKAHRQALLSTRQLEILELVAAGTRYSEIGAKLFISRATVNREMRNIFNCLGVNDAAHAVAEAYQKGLF